MMFPSSIRHPRSPIRAKSPGFALPMSIIAIAGLTLLLIGLLSIISLERKTARSYSDSARADLAVESGLAVALASLSEIAGRDDTLVFRIEDPVEPKPAATDRPSGFREQFFSYGAVFENGAWRGIPLFSGSNPFSPGNREIATSAGSPAMTHLTTFLSSTPVKLTNPGQNEHAVPRAQWVDVSTSNPDDYQMRYAYWIEDLEGRLDGKSAGSEPRGEGKSTAEIPLFTFFGETPAGIADTLVAKRASYRTSGSTRGTLTPAQSAGFEPGMYYGFPPIDPAAPRPPALIPQGFGYADAGKPAKDLNDLVTRSAGGGSAGIVTEMSNHIRSNLPDFESTRRGGFPNSDGYIETLCASAIDYADTDSNPTTAPRYRGVDSYPFVNQITDRYLVLPPPANNPGLIRVQCRTFVELWNPTNKSISGTIRLTNINNVGITAGGPRMMSTRNLRTNPVLSPVTLAPNQHRVLELYNEGTTGTAVVYQWTSGIPTVPPYTAIASSTNNYELYWNNVMVDKARMATQFERAQGGPSINATQTNAYASGNCPELEPAEGAPGDPRATWYITRRVRTLNYEANTSWGGRNVLTNQTPDKAMLISPDAGQPGVPGWLDRGANAPLGKNPSSRSNVPGPTGIVNATSGALVRLYETNRPDMAPSRISNLGYFLSRAELGHVFDPAQWTSVDVVTSPANSGAGGGITLAIGRPEYKKFDIEGRRAAQLIDLFDAKRPAAAPPVTPSRKVNINTASRDTLRALMAGVILSSDATLPGVKPPRAAKIGDLFADAVIHSRSQAALRGPSDLNTIRLPSALGHFFGNRDIYPAADRPADSWSDAGREELFARVLDLVSFGSKTYRIIVAGQTLDRNGKVVSTSRREYHYSIEPARGADGAVNAALSPVLRSLYAAEP
jgi:hypothetical protein